MKFRPTNLRLDFGRWEDLFITGNPKPVFSWAVQATANNQHQSACRIQIETNGHSVWDSNWIPQKEQQLVYDGEPLESSTTYLFTLMVRNSDGCYSEPVQRTFTTALLEPWPAQWIQPAEDYGDSAIYATKRFSLTQLPASSMLYACGIGCQQLYLNGYRIDPGEHLSPSVSSYHKRCYYTAHANLQHLLRIGENVIGIIVAPGWRRNTGAYLDATGGREIPFMGPPQLTAVLEMAFEHGSVTRICTDESWRCQRGPITYTNLYQGETYDARQEIPDWCLPASLQAGAPCRIAQAPGSSCAMQLQELEPIRACKVYRPRYLVQPRAGVFIFDFGQNLAGICEIRIPPDFPEGAQITLRHAELLNEQGMLNTAPLRTAAAMDTYIAGSGRHGARSWMPSFSYHGFRFVEVTGLRRVPDHDFICAHAIYNAVDNRSTFRCGNGMVNQLQEAIVATERANLHGVPTDCPQRDERMFWLNDATVRFEEMLFNLDAGRLFPKIVRDIIDSQASDGAIPCTVPYIYGAQPTDPVCSSFLIAVRQAYLQYGNVELVREAYPALCAWNDCIYRFAHEDLIPYTLYGDWASPEDCCMKIAPFSAVTPGAVLSTGFCYYNATLLAWFAQILGLQEAAQKHVSRADKIRTAMLRRWLQKDGTFATGSQACQAFALWIGIIPEAQQPLVAGKLHEAVAAAGYRLTTGNLCTLYVMDALADHGYMEDAWTLLTREAYPSWGYMLQNDATTIWERFELKKDPKMNSHCHPMYGAVGAWLYTHLAGIRPTEAGYSKVIIQPRIPAQLTFAEVILDTCKGDFLVKWQKQYGKLTLYVTIPFGSEAEIHTPGGVCHVKSGTYVFSCSDSAAQ